MYKTAKLESRGAHVIIRASARKRHVMEQRKT